MFSKDMLIGILLSSSKVDFNIERTADSLMGYRVRLKLVVRADSIFLEGVRRSLAQHQITCSVKQKESKSRPKPILKIGGIKNLYKLTQLVPENLPHSKSEWVEFRELVDLISNHKHKTSEGMERIFELKGVI